MELVLTLLPQLRKGVHGELRLPGIDVAAQIPGVLMGFEDGVRHPGYEEAALDRVVVDEVSIGKEDLRNVKRRNKKLASANVFVNILCGAIQANEQDPLLAKNRVVNLNGVLPEFPEELDQGAIHQVLQAEEILAKGDIEVLGNIVGYGLVLGVE